MARRKMIPKRIELAGQEIQVEFEDDLAQEQGAVGMCKFQQSVIKIQKSIAGTKISKDHQDQTYCHELTHWILFTMGENELCQNEKFVDLFGQFLHQALKSAKFQ